jgi:hypothetical protein
VLSPLEELITKSQSDALESSTWLGSESHRIVLDEALHPVFGLTGWKIGWSEPGKPSYTEVGTKTIRIERVTSESSVLSDDEMAEYVALTLLHEALHARFSSSSGTYQAKYAALRPSVQPPTDLLFQRIEDARVQRLAVASDQSLAQRLLQFHDAGISQREADYQSKYSASPWTVRPASERNQLFIAIERRLFHPGEALTLHPAVVAELAKCEMVIAPVWAGTTETAGLSAIDVVTTIITANLSG